MIEAPKYLRGQLLLDSGQLNGSFFQRTSCSSASMMPRVRSGWSSIVPAETNSARWSSPTFRTTQGAAALSWRPVQLSALSFLHSDNFLPEASVMPNLDLGHSLDSLVEIGESFSPTKK